MASLTSAWARSAQPSSSLHPTAVSTAGPDPDQIVAWCHDAMANYKVPRLVVVVDHLPMNASGKVLKFDLRDRAAALRDR